MRQHLWSLIRLSWGVKVSPKIVEGFDLLIRDVPFRMRLGGAGAVRLEAAGSGIDGAMASLVKIVYRAQIDEVWGRLKTCSSPDCSRTFYDYSNNQSGRWCIKTTCGDRLNSRRHRRRRYF